MGNQLVIFFFFFPLLMALSFYTGPLNLIKAKMLALIGSLLLLVLNLIFLSKIPDLNSSTLLYKMEMDFFYGLFYSINIDGLSAILLVLNSLLTVIVVLSTWNFNPQKIRLYYFCIFFLTFTVNGSLMTESLYTFYVFWEAMLIPLFILVGVFGGKNRKYASYKFFLFTASGSIVMLGALFYLSSLAHLQLGSYNLTPEIIKNLGLKFDGVFSPQGLVFIAFCLAFFIKVPVFPFHSWLPDAHVEAPTAGSIILAGILLKLGVYALLRFVIPVFPEAVNYFRYFIVLLGVIGIVYGALIAMAQTDIKKIVAFSSVSHMGYIIAGLFSPNIVGPMGAVFQMVSHGITTGGLFVAVNCLYERRHTRELGDFGGIAQKMPVFAVCFFLMILGSMAVPLTNGFVGEFLITYGIYSFNAIFGIFAALGVILGPIYLLKLYQKSMLGPITQEENFQLKDLGKLELIPFIILSVFIIVYGIYPRGLSVFYEESVKKLILQ